MRLGIAGVSIFIYLIAAVPSLRAEVNRDELLGKVKTSSFNHSLFKDRITRLRSRLERDTIAMTEEECIKKAIASNPIVRQAQYEIESQEKALMSARFGWMPKLSISGTPVFGKYWDSTTKIPIKSSVEGVKLNKTEQFSDNYYNYVSADIGWTFLDIPRDKRIQQRLNNLQQYKSLYNLVVRDLIRDVQLVYARLQANLLALNKYGEIVEASSKAVSVLESQYKVKYVSLADVSNARTQQLNVMETYLSLYGQIESDSAKLAGLIGYSDNTFVIAKGDITEPGQWQMNFNDSIEAAKLQNDKYKALKLSSRAQAAQAESLIWSTLPKLFVKLSGYYQGNRGYYDADVRYPNKEYDNATTRYYEGYAGIGFTINFDGGMSILEGQSVELQSKVTNEKALSAQISYVESVKMAYENLDIDRLRVEAARSAVNEAENVGLVMNAVSSLGLVDTLQQVQSIELYENAVIGLVTALLSAKTSEVNLYRYTSTLPEELEGIKLYKIGL